MEDHLSLSANKNEETFRGVTIIILCCGVLGGLFITLSVIIFCKFCDPETKISDQSPDEEKPKIEESKLDSKPATKEDTYIVNARKKSLESSEKQNNHYKNDASITRTHHSQSVKRRQYTDFRSESVIRKSLHDENPTPASFGGSTDRSDGNVNRRTNSVQRHIKRGSRPNAIQRQHRIQIDDDSFPIDRTSDRIEADFRKNERPGYALLSSHSSGDSPYDVNAELFGRRRKLDYSVSVYSPSPYRVPVHKGYSSYGLFPTHDTVTSTHYRYIENQRSEVNSDEWSNFGTKMNTESHQVIDCGRHLEHRDHDQSDPRFTHPNSYLPLEAQDGSDRWNLSSGYGWGFRRCLSEKTPPPPPVPYTHSRSESCKVSRFGQGNPAHTSYSSQIPYGNNFVADFNQYSSPRDLFRYSWRDGMRRQSSLECGELEDMLENRRQLEQEKMDLAQSHSASDEDGPQCKVRYNDVGSIEKIQCRALWHLRTTFEEEDPLEEDQESLNNMDVAHSVESSFKGLVADSRLPTSQSTSFDSRSDASNNTMSCQPLVATSSAIQHISSEERRTSYKNLLAQRFKNLDKHNRTSFSTENSFDSCETDWSSTTDLSRPEVITTSIESTTDCQTDSTGDTHSHRLQQMKYDSGYKSLETKTTCLQESQEHSMELDHKARSPDKIQTVRGEFFDDAHIKAKSRRFAGFLDKRNSQRQSSKKRRELLKDWHHISLDAGMALEAEANSGDEMSGKRSVLARFLRNHQNISGGSLRLPNHRVVQRDYSIDEKSDRLFKEFSLPEQRVNQENEDTTKAHRSHSSSRRVNRQLIASDSSPRSHRRKLSPQDSIEEEAMWEDSMEQGSMLSSQICSPSLAD